MPWKKPPHATSFLSSLANTEFSTSSCFFKLGPREGREGCALSLQRIPACKTPSGESWLKLAQCGRLRSWYRAQGLMLDPHLVPHWPASPASPRSPCPPRSAGSRIENRPEQSPPCGQIPNQDDQPWADRKALRELLSNKQISSPLPAPAPALTFSSCVRMFQKHTSREERREEVGVMGNSGKQKEGKHKTKQGCSRKAEVEQENSS